MAVHRCSTHGHPLDFRTDGEDDETDVAWDHFKVRYHASGPHSFFLDDFLLLSVSNGRRDVDCIFLHSMIVDVSSTPTLIVSALLDGARHAAICSTLNISCSVIELLSQFRSLFFLVVVIYYFLLLLGGGGEFRLGGSHRNLPRQIRLSGLARFTNRSAPGPATFQLERPFIYWTSFLIS